MVDEVTLSADSIAAIEDAVTRGVERALADHENDTASGVEELIDERIGYWRAELAGAVVSALWDRAAERIPLLRDADDGPKIAPPSTEPTGDTLEAYIAGAESELAEDQLAILDLVVIAALGRPGTSLDLYDEVSMGVLIGMQVNGQLEPVMNAAFSSVLSHYESDEESFLDPDSRMTEAFPSIINLANSVDPNAAPEWLDFDIQAILDSDEHAELVASRVTSRPPTDLVEEYAPTVLAALEAALPIFEREYTQGKAAAEYAAALPDRFSVTRATFRRASEDILGRRAPLIDLEYRNDLDVAVSRIFVALRLYQEGREIPFVEDVMNTKVSGGIEPGESDSGTYDFSRRDDWDQVPRDREGLLLEAAVYRVDDANEEPIFFKVPESFEGVVDESRSWSIGSGLGTTEPEWRVTSIDWSWLAFARALEAARSTAGSSDPPGLSNGEGVAIEGPDIYRRMACFACHGHDGKGALAGPELSGLGAVWTRDELAEFIADPASWETKDPRIAEMASEYTTKMTRPMIPMSEEDLLLLADWLMTL